MTPASVEPLLPYAGLLFGVFCAALGGEFFVRGTVGVAAAARVSPGVIAATVAAFATSSPELTVAVSSALAGEPQISFGDALGSNVANIALILGAALTLGPLAFDRASLLRDYGVATAAPLAIAFILRDGEVSRLDSTLLLTLFVIWIAVVLRAAFLGRANAMPDDGGVGYARAAGESLLGLVLLVAAGKLIVFGAAEIARRFGMSEFVIGSTLVAVGTSTPELATAIVARLRRHDDVGVGALFGSNIFNALFITGVASAISPINLPIGEAAPALAGGLAAMLVAYPPRSGVYPVWRGVALLVCYAAYLVATVVVER